MILKTLSYRDLSQKVSFKGYYVNFVENFYLAICNVEIPAKYLGMF